MSNFSRRDFLYTSMLVAAAAGAQGCSKDKPEAEKPVEKPAPPSERLRIAICGVRGRGDSHVHAFAAMKDVEIAAICDIDTSMVGPHLKYIEDKSGKRPAYVQDFRHLLADRSIDAVSLATPNHWHALQTIWAVEAGKDVYVEKPASHNVYEGRVMVDAARRYEKVVQVGTDLRSNDVCKKVFDYMKAKKLGDVTIARALCYKPRGSIGKKPDEPLPPPGVDYNLWLGPAPIRPFNRNRFHYEWHWNWDYGNGDIGNQGVHQMDVARAGLGKMSLPNKVVSYGGRFGYEDDGQTPNTMISILDYGMQQVIFEVRGLKTDKHMTQDIGVIFHCKEGYVVLSAGGGGAAFDKTGKEIQKFEGTGNHFRNFIDCVKTRRWRDLKTDVYEGHLSAAMCHMANASYRVGADGPIAKTSPTPDNAVIGETYGRYREHLKSNGIIVDEAMHRIGPMLDVDTRNENFFNNEKANAFLTREYRKPFVVLPVL